ncbi:MAG TPA: GNAT family N-acetyltransferase [Casimicrobiaceae bacterium]|nr:GNAT family N-acetyltransferase [Casimicrobiaceae bacterium]
MNIRRLTRIEARDLDGLCELLIDCVEGGASVSFMLPMTRGKALAYWRDVAASATRCERIVLAAYDGTRNIVGTVQVVFAQPENQLHRADIAKMLVHRRGRRRGVGAALLIAAERHALRSGKTVLVLDTASDDAERLYVRQGWRLCGRIPDYAFMPDGAPCATAVYYKSLRGP